MNVIKDRESAFKILSTPMSLSKYSDFTDDFLIQMLFTRYSEDLFKCDYLDEIEFYRLAKKDIESLFAGRNHDQEKLLAVSIVEALKTECCKYELTIALEWFISAAIHVCFTYLKDNSELFKHAFCMFDVNGGKTESFCRLIIIARLENYCRFEYTDTQEFYCHVFKHDGEPIDNNRYLIDHLRSFLFNLWKEWYPYGSKNDALRSLYALLRINNYSKYQNIKSAYWMVRDRVH